MSHFSRPMHLFSGYVSARARRLAPFVPLLLLLLLHLHLLLFPFLLLFFSCPPSPSGLYLTVPHTMAPDAANFAALLAVHPRLFLSLASVRRTLLPLHSFSFFFPFAAVRFLLFFSFLFLFPLRGYARFRCANGERGNPPRRGYALRTRSACACSLSKERADSRCASYSPPTLRLPL